MPLLATRYLPSKAGSGEGFGGINTKSLSNGSPCRYAFGASPAAKVHFFDAAIDQSKLNAIKEAVGESLLKSPISLWPCTTNLLFANNGNFLPDAFARAFLSV